MQYVVILVLILIVIAAGSFGYIKFFSSNEVSFKEQEMQRVLERSRK